MSVADGKITINGKEYEMSPLKMKHIKEITAMVGKPTPTALLDSLARWLPFVCYSIKVKHPDFKDEELDEATLPEINATPDVLLAVSGIVIRNVPKEGEAMPADLTGGVSTAGSLQPVAGPIETSTTTP